MYTFTLIDGNSFEGHIESESLSVKHQTSSGSKTAFKIDMSKVVEIVREEDTEGRISAVFKYFAFTFTDGSRLNIGFDRLKVSAVVNKDDEITIRYRDGNGPGRIKFEELDSLVSSPSSAIQSESLAYPHRLTLKNNQEIRGTILLKSLTLPAKGYTSFDEIEQIYSLGNSAFEFKCKGSQQAIQATFPDKMELIKVETSFCSNRFFPVYIQDVLSIEKVDIQAHDRSIKNLSDFGTHTTDEEQDPNDPEDETPPSDTPEYTRSPVSSIQFPRHSLWSEQIEPISHFLKRALQRTFSKKRALSKHLKIGIFGRPRTGKTTYIALLFYILTKAKIDGIFIARASKHLHPETAEYLKEITDIFTESTTWDEASERIYRTVRKADLYLEITYNNKKFPVQISDYDGKQIGPDVEGYRLTRRDVDVLSQERMPEEYLCNLEALVDREFTTEKEFLARVNQQLGEDGFDAYKDQLLRFAERHRTGQNELFEAKEGNDVIEDYLLQCDAIMLFYALQESYDNRKKGLNSPEEFNAFLNDLRRLKRFYRDIPVILVITKHDLIVDRKTFSNADDAVKVLTEEEYLKQLQDEYFREEYQALKTFWGKELPYLAISAKEAFEYYIQPDNHESPQNNTDDFPGEYKGWFKQLNAPLEELLDQLRRIERKEFIWGIILGFLISALIAGAIGLAGLFRPNS